jgi:uncharacterized cupin superfamily protein
MNDVTIKRIEELDCYEGPHKIPGIRFRHAGQDLGVKAWGMNVLELGPRCEGYPEHNHAGVPPMLNDGQEELYVVLRGVATLRFGGESQRLEAGSLVRVGPSCLRKWVTGDEGAVLLALGATPGKAYEPRP